MFFIEKARQAMQLCDKGEAIDLLSEIISALLGDHVSAAKAMFTLSTAPFLLHERLFWEKMEQYLDGVYLSDNDCAILCAKLMENGSTDENAKRLIECIGRAETKRKIRFLINATRCFLADFIDRTAFFRICSAISNTIDEDLLYLKANIEHTNFRYTDAVQGLLVSGLVTFSVLGGEETLYSFTPLARMVDRYAVSYDDVTRYPNPVTLVPPTIPNVSLTTATGVEVKEMLDDVFGGQDERES